MRPRLTEVGARRDIMSRQNTMVDMGFNFRNYCLNWGSLGHESTQVPSGPEFI